MSTGGKLYNIDFIIEDEVFYSTKGYYKKEPIKTKISITTNKRMLRSSEECLSFSDSAAYSPKEEFDYEITVSNASSHGGNEDSESEKESEGLFSSGSSNKRADSTPMDQTFEKLPEEEEESLDFGTPNQPSNQRRQRKLLAKIVEDEEIPLLTKQKRELTEDELAKNREIAFKRRLQARQYIEQIKQKTLDKILNETSKRQREKNRKKQKEKEHEMKMEAISEAKKNEIPTCIKIIYHRKGNITLSFPQGLLIPKYLNQRRVDKSDKMNMKNICNICKKEAKYKLPKTLMRACSLECYKRIIALTKTKTNISE